MTKHKKQADLKTLLSRRKMTVQTLMARRALTTREELVAWCPLNGIAVEPPAEKKAAKKRVQKKKKAPVPDQPKPEPEPEPEAEPVKKPSTGSTRM